MSLTEHLEKFSPKRESDKIEEFLISKRSEIEFGEAVIGLSGGLDSSIATVLGKRAFSNENIEVVFLPETTTTRRDWEDVNLLEREFDLSVRVIEIDEFVSAYKKKMTKLSKLTEANLKPRIRMTLLYAIANQNNGLVVGTGNLSEWLLGYFTKYGDGAADLAPLNHLFKTETRKLARFLNIPESIISKPPSAGLWEGQTDEDELGGTYDEIDQVLYCKHELDFSLEETKKTVELDPDFVSHVFDLVEKSTHKRKPPPSLTRE
ncbi:MAG: NAD+ synthase [Candidatus Bipolaricaulota bacterium]